MLGHAGAEHVQHAFRGLDGDDPGAGGGQWKGVASPSRADVEPCLSRYDEGFEDVEGFLIGAEWVGAEGRSDGRVEVPRRRAFAEAFRLVTVGADAAGLNSK